jgi:hypothetical protein
VRVLVVQNIVVGTVVDGVAEFDEVRAFALVSGSAIVSGSVEAGLFSAVADILLLRPTGTFEVSTGHPFLELVESDGTG